MPDLLRQIQLDLKNWAIAAKEKGWLNERAIQAIDATTTATPGALFDQANRPLVIGFFGGTGVGKSTLMNRFAGENVAHASAERPTSREITLYVHESVSVTKLPDEFPVQRMRTQSHQNNQYRSVLWIDMPDFDSVEQSNRELVELWMPHIDVIIYVVSPDRYRDDHGWRLLLEHGTEHAWVFVINHWDRGDERQRDDFRTMLNSAGLDNPHLFVTDSSESNNSQSGHNPTNLNQGNVNQGNLNQGNLNQISKTTDEFNALRETINQLADQQLIEQLESRGVVQRINRIREVTDSLRAQMSTPEQLQQLNPLWQSSWQTSTIELTETVDWKVPGIAKLYAEQEQGLLGSLYAKIRGRETPTDSASATIQSALENLLDDSFYDRVNESVDTFSQQATSTGIAFAAINHPIKHARPEWRNRARTHMQAAIEQSIATPGTPLQRLMHRVLGWLCWLLPLAAMGWIGFRVINVFRLGANDPAAYLSSNFAVHSLLLLGLAWLVPTVLYIKLKPSREKAAARGIRQGVIQVTQYIDEQIQTILQQLGVDQQQRVNELDSIMTAGVQIDEHALPEALQRMLIQEPPAVPVIGVRATTQS